MDKYYKDMVKFFLRDGLCKIVDKYIEWLEDTAVHPNVEMTPAQMENIQQVMNDFKIWIFTVLQ